MFERPDAAPSLSDHVAQTLMDRIDAGELYRGEHTLSETVLGQEFGVSRIMIREAISRLRHEGVVETCQGSGVHVTQQAGPKPLRIDTAQAGSIDAVLHTIELRHALEAEDAALTAQRRTDAEMIETDAALNSIDAAVAVGGDSVTEDLCFHRVIVAASGNPFLVQTLGFLSQYLEEAISVTCSNETRREDLARQARDEHRAMAEAIRHRDAFATRNAAQTHMFNAARRLAEGRDAVQDRFQESFMTQLAADRKAGVIGLGAMGPSIVKTLRNHGYTVYACDTRPGAAADFAKEGGVAYTTPAGVAVGAGVVVSVVVNVAQTEAVLFGEAGAAGVMRWGSTFIMCSTVDPNWSIALEARLTQQGVLYVDGPTSGGVTKAVSGQMTMVISVTSEAYAAVGDMLDAMVGKVYRLSDKAGAGSKVKIVNQLLAGVHIATAAEAMALGLREGVTVDALYEAITHSAGNSWMLENRMAYALVDDYMPLSAVDIFVKDLGFVPDTACVNEFPLSLAATAHQMFTQTSTVGYAREGDSAVIKIFPGIVLPEDQPK